MMADFTYGIYGDLLDAALDADYAFLPVREYLAREDPPDTLVVMRHDVDRKPGNALDMARMEAERGVATTYYFRTTEGVFDPSIIREVESLGHEVGYHYEDVDRADGDLAAAHDLFATNLARLRELVTVETVCMHGNPLTPYDNREMWMDADQLDEYDLLGEAYLSVDFEDLTYFSDTNRTWYDEKTIVNDWPVGPNGKRVQVSSTDELIDLVERGEIDRLYLLAHPNRWADSYPELVAEMAKDGVIDAGKWGLWMLSEARSRWGATTSR